MALGVTAKLACTKMLIGGLMKFVFEPQSVVFITYLTVRVVTT